MSSDADGNINMPAVVLVLPLVPLVLWLLHTFNSHGAPLQ